MAKVLTERFEALLGPEVEALQPITVDPPGHPRRLRRRLTWLFLRPGAAGPHRDLTRAPCARARSARHPGAAAGADRGGVAAGGRGLPAVAVRVADLRPSCSGSTWRSRGSRACLATLPAGRPGGWVAAGLPHRSWIDPFLAVDGAPAGAAAGRSSETRGPWPARRSGAGSCTAWAGSFRSRRTAGRAPLPPTSRRRRVLHAGAVFCLFPESGLPVPVGTARPISPGVGYIALRSGASVVPIVIGGNDAAVPRTPDRRSGSVSR